MDSHRIRYLQNWTFLFKQPEWGNRFMMATVINLIPLVGPIMVQGWTAELMHRRVRGDGRLPDFSDIGRLLKNGLHPFLLTLVFGVLMSIIINVVVMVAMFGVGVVVTALGSAGLDEGVQMVLALGSQLVIALFVLLVVIALIVPFNAALITVEMTGNMGDGFKPAKVLQVAKSAIGPLILGSFINGVFSIVLFCLGYVACFVGLFPAITLIAIANAELRIQVYRRFLAGGGESLATSSFIDGGPIALDAGPWDPPPPTYGPPPGQYPGPPGPPQAGRW